MTLTTSLDLIVSLISVLFMIEKRVSLPGLLSKDLS